MRAFLTLALGGSKCSASLSGHFTPKERDHRVHWRVELGGGRFILDIAEKRKSLLLSGIES
jgi:hypothetical protein